MKSDLSPGARPRTPAVAARKCDGTALLCSGRRARILLLRVALGHRAEPIKPLAVRRRWVKYRTVAERPSRVPKAGCRTDDNPDDRHKLDELRGVCGAAKEGRAVRKTSVGVVRRDSREINCRAGVQNVAPLL